MAQMPRPAPDPIVNGVASAHSAPATPTITSSHAPSKAKGLQLGATKQSLSKSSLAAELGLEAAAETGAGDVWGDEGDLIDVNADAGDWSEPLNVTSLVRWSPLTLYSNCLADFQSGPAPLELEDAWGDSLDQESNEPAPTASTVASPALAHVARAAEPPRPPLNGLPQHHPQPIKLQNSATAQRKSPPVPTVHTPSAAAPSRPVALAIPGNWNDDFDDSSSPSPAPAPSSVVGSMAGMTKEEKAAEMARRREERKQVCKSMLRRLDVETNSFATNVAHCCTEGAEKGGRKVAS